MLCVGRRLLRTTHIFTLLMYVEHKMARNRRNNWYVSKVDLVQDENGRLTAFERVLTVPEGSKSLKAGRRVAGATLARMKAMGIEDIYLCPPDHKRYNRLFREQNKRNKARKLNKGDIAEILAEENKTND